MPPVLPLRQDESSAPAASTPEACAAQVIEVVPGVMDGMRFSMRRHIGDGLSVPQFRCLGYIGRTPGASVSDVAAFLGVTVATASALVDRLVRMNHVETAESTIDRRRRALRLKAPGRALLRRIGDGARRDLAVVLARVDAADLAVLARAMTVLRVALDPV